MPSAYHGTEVLCLPRVASAHGAYVAHNPRGDKDLAANKSTKNHRSKAGRQQAREAEAKAQAALDRLGEGERGIEILVPMLVKCRDDPPEGAYGYFKRGCAGHELTLEIGIVRTVRKRILWPPVAFLWPK